MARSIQRVVPGSDLPRMQYNMMQMSSTEDIAIMKKQLYLRNRPSDMQLEDNVRIQLQLRYRPQLAQADDYYREAVQETPILHESHYRAHREDTRLILKEYWDDVQSLLGIQRRKENAIEAARPRASSPPSMMFVRYREQVAGGRDCPHEPFFTKNLRTREEVSDPEVDQAVWEKLKRCPTERQRDDARLKKTILFGKREERWGFWHYG